MKCDLIVGSSIMGASGRNEMRGCSSEGSKMSGSILPSDTFGSFRAVLRSVKSAGFRKVRKGLWNPGKLFQRSYCQVCFFSHLIYSFCGTQNSRELFSFASKKKHYFSQQAINIVPSDFCLCKCKVQDLDLLPIPISPNVQPSSLLVALKAINWLKFCDLPLGFV
ncbi:hypothetical protein E2320_013073, partial [Naja naja]